MGSTVSGKEDTAFLGNNLEEAMKTPPSDKAFEIITEIVRLFDGEVWIVSKCGPITQNKTKRWLELWKFYKITSFRRENIRFCLKRSEKSEICRQLGISHFVDDRLDVLESMRGVVDNLYLFGEQRCNIPDWLFHVKNWQCTLQTIESRI